MAEMPGIYPLVSRFARRVRDAGFTVWMPQLFGDPGAPISVLRGAGVMLRACISREFRAFDACRGALDDRFQGRVLSDASANPEGVKQMRPHSGYPFSRQPPGVRRSDPPQAPASSEAKRSSRSSRDGPSHTGSR